ncbi:SUR7/PalI family-domain-containing protein [Xylariaceae sp. FL1651]|nr:SUR7/PalI family-domain-containing protein [Xylariaceae sp. FL1651]
MAVRKPSGLTWVFAIFLSLITLLFILITLLSGVGGHTSASYLTIDTTNLAVAAKLSSSTFLQDLSKISGSDLVGQNANRESLGLSSTYSISLLTACGRTDDGSESCCAPHVGFAFNPSSDLKLGRTGASTFSASYYSQLHTYATVSAFVAAAYIIATPLMILSCLCIVLSRRFNGAATISRVSSAIAMFLVVAAAIASVVTFVKLRDTFNAALSDLGVNTTTSSSAFGLSLAAAATSTAAFVLACLHRPASSGARGRHHHEKQGIEGGVGGGGAETSLREARPANIGAGFMKRVPTWGRPRYAQIQNRQQATVHSRDPSPESDREGLMARDDAAHGAFPSEHEYPQGSWEKKRTKQHLDLVQTSYRPNAVTI